MTDKTKSATSVKISIQDIIIGRTPIPYHIELGYANPMCDQLIDVRAIDVPVEIKFRAGKTVIFQPGSRSANIECITYSCIIANDLVDIDDLSSFLPEKPDTIRIGIDEWMNRMNSDNLPENWFIQHRNRLMLQVNVEVNWGSDRYEPLIINAGTEWGDLVNQVQRRAQVLELAQSDEVRKRHANKKLSKDYSSVMSKPASLKEKTMRDYSKGRDISNFMKDATGIFNE